MFCSQCGTANPDDARFCEQCGAPLDPEERRLVAQETGFFGDGPAAGIAYGGFWRRVAAALVDMLVLILPLTILQLLLAPASLAGDQPPGAGAFWTWWDTMNLAVGWLYWAGMHSSSYQATVGKMLMGMKVTDLQGERISFARATGRYFAEILSGLLLMIGYIMVAFTRRKQGLHDKIAGTLVVRVSS
ncbi:RDD family protein [Aquisalimonas sp.]|uniref:RDD family protein n=1 Tax=unclassified Aquisalimonas TaxID=2644645 RepID=UPI0025B888A2|nr:RDD family protein [Aquisalimonas sp.]